MLRVRRLLGGKPQAQAGRRCAGQCLLDDENLHHRQQHRGELPGRDGQHAAGRLPPLGRLLDEETDDLRGGLGAG